MCHVLSRKAYRKNYLQEHDHTKTEYM